MRPHVNNEGCVPIPEKSSSKMDCHIGTLYLNDLQR